MRIPGHRVKRTRLIRTDRFVVAVEVEAVIPPDDPSEPCYESEIVEFLKTVNDRAQQGDVAWLQAHGRVYEAVAEV